MAQTDTAGGVVKMKFAWDRSGSLSTGSDDSKGERSYEVKFTHGSEDGQMGKVWHEPTVLVPGDNEFSLHALAQQSWHSDAPLVIFSKIRAVFFRNHGNTGVVWDTSKFKSWPIPFNTSLTTEILIPANGIFALVNPLGAGWAILAGSAEQNFWLTNPTGSNITVDIGIIGTAA